MSVINLSILHLAMEQSAVMHSQQSCLLNLHPAANDWHKYVVNKPGMRSLSEWTACVPLFELKIKLLCQKSLI